MSDVLVMSKILHCVYNGCMYLAYRILHWTSLNIYFNKKFSLLHLKKLFLCVFCQLVCKDFFSFVVLIEGKLWYKCCCRRLWKKRTIFSATDSQYRIQRLPLTDYILNTSYHSSGAFMNRDRGWHAEGIRPCWLYNWYHLASREKRTRLLITNELNWISRYTSIIKFAVYVH